MRYFNDRGCSISNVNPSSTSVVPGESFTVSFKLALSSSASAGAINGDVVVTIGKGRIEDNRVIFGPGFILKTFQNVSIARGKSKTYNATGIIPTNRYWGVGDFLYLNVEADNSSGFYDCYASDVTVYLMEHANPTIGTLSMSDRKEMPVAADGTPLEYFGDYLALASLPRMSFDFALDAVNANDPNLTAMHELTYTCGATTMTYAQATAHGVTSVEFDLPAMPLSGTVTWSYTITDSYGQTDTETGSFAVLAYSPPTIANMLLERYKIVQSAGGATHEPADDGVYLWLTLAATIAAVDSKNAWTAVMKYWDVALGESTATTVTSQDGWTLGGTDGTTIALTRDENQLAGLRASDAKDYGFRLTITDKVGNVAELVSYDIVKAGAIIDVTQGGVAVGQRSTGSVANPLFEVNYPAILNNDVVIPVNRLLKVVTVDGTVSVSTSSPTATKTLAVTAGTGFTPIGVVGFEASQSWCAVRQARLVNGSVEMAIRYHGSSSTSQTVTLTADVLCLHTTLN